MSSLSTEVELLYHAMGTPLGIAVQVSDFTNGQSRLYRARNETGDPELSRLQIRRSLAGEDNVIWIVKGPEKAPANGKTPSE